MSVLAWKKLRANLTYKNKKKEWHLKMTWKKHSTKKMLCKYFQWRRHSRHCCQKLLRLNLNEPEESRRDQSWPFHNQIEKLGKQWAQTGPNQPGGKPKLPFDAFSPKDLAYQHELLFQHRHASKGYPQQKPKKGIFKNGTFVVWIVSLTWMYFFFLSFPSLSSLGHK